jgi:hypothetical protein
MLKKLASSRLAAAAEMLKKVGFLVACRRYSSLIDLHALTINPNTGEVTLVMERMGPSLHDALYGYGVRHCDGLPTPCPPFSSSSRTRTVLLGLHRISSWGAERTF